MSGAAGTLVAERRIHLIQGERQVADDPAVMLTTILGSCVAACLRDPVAGVGGMNHFLLPGDKPDSQTGRGQNAMRYGVHAMELLVNGLLRSGAQHHRLEAKLFGGARMMKGLTDVGELNATFAEQFLKTEKISMVGGSLRGTAGRRIQFWPVSGRARQIVLTSDREVFSAERSLPAPSVRPGAPKSGALELF